MKRYACKDGDRGLWVSPESVYARGVVRNGGMWHWLRTDGMIDPLPGHALKVATVYRDLTLTDVYCEPLAPVQPVAGMRCAWWSHAAHEPDLASDEWKAACRLSLVTIAPEWGNNAVKVDWDSGGIAFYPDTSMLRCAKTGAPLCLPKGENDA